MTMFKIANFRYFSNTLCETGSCWGAGIQRALDAGFTRIKSVELDKKLFHHCIERFKRQNVELFHGKSEDTIHIMLADVYEPIVIMLDAHPAGPGTANHEECLNGQKEAFQDTIITKELKSILEHRKDHLIIIDDQQPGDQAESYMNLLKSSNPNYTFKFYDEQLAPTEPLFRNKVLVCNPNELA